MTEAALGQRSRRDVLLRRVGALPGDPLLWLAFCTVLAVGAGPVVRLILAVMADPSSLDVLFQRSALRALAHTLITGLCAGAISVLIGGVAAMLVVLGDIRIRIPFTIAFTLSMLIAPQIAALGYLEAVRAAAPFFMQSTNGPMQGWSHPLRSLGGIIAILALHHAPLAFLTIRAGLISVPRDVLEAAALDGASGPVMLKKIVFPLVRRRIVVAALLCFIASAGNFGIPALLGISENILTIPTLIYSRLSGLGPGMIADMSALGLILVVLAGVALHAAQKLAGQATPLHGDALSPVGFGRLGNARTPCEAALLGLLFVSLLVPVGALGLAALSPAPGVAITFSTMTLAHVVDLFTHAGGAPLRAIGHSLVFSTSAALICAVLALPCAFVFARLQPKLRMAAELLGDWPFAMPGIVLAVAFILLFLRPLPVLQISLYGTSAIIILAYVTRFFVLAFKPALAALDALDPNVEEAARLCGAGRIAMVRHILFPAIAPALLGGAIMIFLSAFNELTVSALLWGPGTETLGVIMFGYEEAGFSGHAAVLGLTGIVVGVIAVWALDSLRRYCPEGTLPWR